MKVGMDHSGKEISGIEYLRQRILDVYKTPKNSIPLARDFGSDFHLLIDKNVDNNFIMTAYEYAVDAFTNPVNDFDDCEFKRLTVSTKNDHASIDLYIEYDGEEIKLEGINNGRG